MKGYRKIWLGLLVLTAMVINFALVPPKKALALTSGTTMVVTFVPIGSVLVMGAASYLYYLNRYNQPANARGSLGYRGPGEFFVGGFLGAGFVPNSDWAYQIRGQNVIAKQMALDPGPMGGLKLGYFLDSVPYFGIEAEGSIGSQNQPSQTMAVRPAVAGSNVGRVPGQTILDWTMAFHFLGRYGFLKDKEVPFGRLQPYVGLGPGLVVLYGAADSAKNFSLEMEAGLRYMFTKHLGAFLEYKFSKQWSVELESQTLHPSPVTASKAVFDFDRHQVVAGLSYHF